MGNLFSKIFLVLNSDLSEVKDKVFSKMGLMRKQQSGGGLIKERMSFGEFKRAIPEDLLDVASELYKYEYGLDHLVVIEQGSEKIMKSDPNKAPCFKQEVRSLTNLVLGITAFMLLLALLFPPYYVSLPYGLVSNEGFNFLFDPPKRGDLVAMVNVTMLAIELSVIGVIGLAALYIAKKLESAGIRWPFRKKNE